MSQFPTRPAPDGENARHEYDYLCGAPDLGALCGTPCRILSARPGSPVTLVEFASGQRRLVPAHALSRRKPLGEQTPGSEDSG